MTDLTRNMLVGICMITLLALFSFIGWLVATVNITEGPMEALKYLLFCAGIAIIFYGSLDKILQGRRPYTTHIVCSGDSPDDFFSGHVKTWTPLKVGDQYRAKDKMWEVITLTRNIDGVIIRGNLENVINLDDIYENSTKE